MDIDKLIDAAAQAAVEHDVAPPNVPEGNIRLKAALHDAQQTLVGNGINDDRLAAAISLAKLEEQTSSGTITPAIQREINILKEFLHD